MIRKHRVLTLVIAGLNLGCANEEFPHVDRVTHVVLTSYSARWRTIVDSTQVQQVVRFVNARNTKWGGLSDIGGVPIPALRVLMYDSTVAYNRGFQGSFGAGRGFFETQRDGRFASRSAERAELEEFAKILGVPVIWLETGIPKDSLRPGD